MKKGISSVFFCFFVLTSLAFIHVSLASGQGKVAPEFVGIDACKDCHQEYYDSYRMSIHGRKTIAGNPANGQECESCHGPGGSHVEKGGGRGGLNAFRKGGTAEMRSAPCLACHGDSKTLNAWNIGVHKRQGVSCADCHPMHSYKRLGTKAKDPYLCLSCHQQIKSQIARQSHHPILEGKVKCGDCHTPHGGFEKAMLKADSVTDLCYKCHQEKRGPYPFEHSPVAEDCSICHRSHGSNHSALLNNKPPQLCQACHNTGLGHTSSAYTLQHSFGGSATAQKNKFFAKACLNCHGDIHGSNRNPQFLR